MNQSNGPTAESTYSRATNSQPHVLVADALYKSYDRRQALRGLSFSLNAGRILGFLGPNGAGKTTAIRILTTILEPDSGHFSVDGISSKFPDKIRRRIGVLPESLGFPRQMTGIECLTYFGQLYGQSTAEAKTHGMALLRVVGLEQRAKSLINGYSRGMRQRLGIARALANNPSVVFLDEPTLGLDPRGQQELLTLIRRIAVDYNVGVILCSHALTEIESICDDVVILNAGQIVATGSVADVIGQVQRKVSRQSVSRIRVVPLATEVAQRVLEALPNVLKVTPPSEMTGWLRVEHINPSNGDSAAVIPSSNRLLEALIGADVPILGFETEGGRLQDVFFQLTEEDSNE